MSEVGYFPCQHGYLWRIENPWHPSRWRRGLFPGERTFICPCPPESAKPAPGRERASQVADARSGAPENETTVARGR